MSIRSLRKIQIGRETTAGTAVAATRLWRGVGVIEDQLEVVFPQEDVGYVSHLDRSYIPKKLASIELEETEATFEQLPILCTAGIKQLYTGVRDGSGTGYIYAYPLPVTAANTVDALTIEAGDDQQEEEMEYGTAEKITLSGKAGEAVMMSGTLFGRQVTPSSFTGSLSIPPVEEILTSKGKLYLDPYDGTIGATQKSGTLLGFEWPLVTGWFPRFTADGELYFYAARFSDDKMELVIKLTFEHNATAVAEKAYWRAGTTRLLRLLFEGSTLGVAGDVYSKKTLILDAAGRWEKFNKLDEEDGNDIVEGEFRVRYNSTADLFALLTVVNETSSLFAADLSASASVSPSASTSASASASASASTSPSVSPSSA